MPENFNALSPRRRNDQNDVLVERQQLFDHSLQLSSFFLKQDPIFELHLLQTGLAERQQGLVRHQVVAGDRNRDPVDFWRNREQKFVALVIVESGEDLVGSTVDPEVDRLLHLLDDHGHVVHGGEGPP